MSCQASNNSLFSCVMHCQHTDMALWFNTNPYKCSGSHKLLICVIGFIWTVVMNVLNQYKHCGQNTTQRLQFNAVKTFFNVLAES